VFLPQKKELYQNVQYKYVPAHTCVKLDSQITQQQKQNRETD
jgi:hypothetical protein